jgi:hypothetical protein
MDPRSLTEFQEFRDGCAIGFLPAWARGPETSFADARGFIVANVGI